MFILILYIAGYLHINWLRQAFLVKNRQQNMN